MTSENGRPGAGSILWHDLTVERAEEIRDFYGSVVGWEWEPVSMGGYDDFEMLPPGGDGAVAGVCHARGSNEGLPAQWLVYVSVEDLDASLSRCVEGGGALVDGPRSTGDARYCVIRDPAGAVMALYQPGPAGGGTSRDAPSGGEE